MTVRDGGGLFLRGGVDGGLGIPVFGEEGVEREGMDFCWSSKRFLNSRSFSSFSRPVLKHLTHELVIFSGGCLLRPKLLISFVFFEGILMDLAYVCRGSTLLASTWVYFRDWGYVGWIFHPPFSTVSLSTFGGCRRSLRLFRDLLSRANCGRWLSTPQCLQAGLQPETITGSLRPSKSNHLGRSYSLTWCQTSILLPFHHM